MREFASQGGEHSEAVHVGHPDIGEEDIRLQFPDQFQAGLAVGGGANDLAAHLGPRDNGGEPPEDQRFIIHKHDAVHIITLQKD